VTRWEEMMTVYRWSHRHPVNVAIHVVLVPVIVCSVLTAFGWARGSVLGLTVSGAWLAVVASLVFYFTLDAVLAAAFLPLVLALAWIAERLAILPWQRSAAVAAIGFFGGFAVQFVGHAIEGRRPALLKSPGLGPLTAPLFVVAELVKPLGIRRALWERVDAEIARRETQA
jgi:uncharacterized membrane protein YGL010W